MEVKIFISHSTSDEALASALVDCLLSSMELQEQEVRCTSVAGHRLPVGSETAVVLRDELGSSSVVVGLMTLNAISSGWVSFELGAAWGAKKRLFPLVAGSVSFSQLPGPLPGYNIVKLNDKNGVVQTVDEIALTTGVKKRSSAKIDSAIDKFVKTAREYEAAEKNLSKRNLDDLSGGGPPFEALYRGLLKEKVDADQIDGTGTRSLLELSIHFAHYLAPGVTNQENASELERAIFYQVASRLVVYGLVIFGPLPGNISWQRLLLSNKGNNFIAWVKMLPELNSPKAP